MTKGHFAIFCFLKKKVKPQFSLQTYKRYRCASIISSSGTTYSMYISRSTLRHLIIYNLLRKQIRY